MAKIDTNTIELHHELNPKLWSNDVTLQQDVHAALLRIAQEFYQFLDFNAPLIDIQITGSQANYTYSMFSDIDLHLIVPFTKVKCDQPVEQMFDAKRKLWKERHNITVHGIPVEVYVEDRDRPVTGSVYSLLTDKWLKHPQRVKAHWDNDAVSRDTMIWLHHLTDAMASKDLNRLEEAKEALSHYRKHGLSASGEFSTENLTFKNLRNLGAIGLLMKAIIRLKDQSLSI